MSGKDVCEHRGSMVSGALSHVYIQHPPLRCSIPETHGIYYDDGNRLILSPTSDQVLSWKVSSSTQTDLPDSDYIGEGPISFLRYSLDKKIIVVQRSDHELQFRNRDTGEVFIHRCKADGEKILGLFWTDCPSCDVVVVKTSGLDLLSYELAFNRLRLIESKRLNVSWYAYTHGSRMVLLASGMQCKQLSGFQFSSAGIVRLPKFEMKLAKAEANHKPVLSAEDVNIVTIYGRIYCLQVDKVDMQLHVYRFYRDAVVHQGSLPIYSSRIAVSVVDNVLLVHQVDAKVVILYDIFLDSLTPVSAPLPLLLRSASRGGSSSQATNTIRQDMLNAYEGMIYGASWKFLVPDLICDVENGLVWKILLDFEAIAASSSEVSFLLEFLQRRRSEPLKAKQLCLMMMRNVILERRPIPMISRALSIIVASYSQDAKMQSTSQRDATRFSSDSRGESSYFDQHKDIDEVADRHKAKGNEPIDSSSVSRTARVSADLQSGSEQIAIAEKRKTTAEQSISKSLSGSSHSSIMKELTDDSLDAGTVSAGFVEPGNMVISLSDIVESAISAVISPADMYNCVFSLVEEEMAGEPAFLISVIIEFLRSAAMEKVSIDSDLYIMMIKLLARDKRHSELGLFVLNKIIEPSKDVALQLVQIGHEHVQTRNLGLDMLRQLSLHNEYVQMLVQYGYYLEALNYVRKKKVIIHQPSLFLEAALAVGNYEHLAAVLRFFSDYVPSFQGSSDFHRYSSILNEVH